MRAKAILAGTVGSLVLLASFSHPADAGVRERSGTYEGKWSNGAYQKKVSRKPGALNKTTTWQNQRGEGSHVAGRNWDKEAGTGSYSSSTTLANGKTFSREGTVTRAENGYVKQGTITGPQGKTTIVDKNVVKNEDGSRTINSAYTGPEGKVLTTQSTVQKTDDGRLVTGTYSTSGGKSGTYTSEVSREGGVITKEQSVTNVEGKTWDRAVTTTHEPGHVEREVTTTNPSGKTRHRRWWAFWSR